MNKLLTVITQFCLRKSSFWRVLVSIHNSKVCQFFNKSVYLIIKGQERFLFHGKWLAKKKLVTLEEKVSVDDDDDDNEEHWIC